MFTPQPENLMLTIGISNAMSRMRDIDWLMKRANCNHQIATAYLEAEEWHNKDAWASLEADRKGFKAQWVNLARAHYRARYKAMSYNVKNKPCWCLYASPMGDRMMLTAEALVPDDWQLLVNNVHTLTEQKLLGYVALIVARSMS